jgi:hypothetical protein
MDDLARLRAWSRRRQRLDDARAETAGEALADVVGVYSAHPTGPLALAARVRGLTGAGFRALEQDRAALRVSAMRGSIFLVPRQDAGRHALLGFDPGRQLRTRLDRWQLSDDDYRRLSDLMVVAAQQPVAAKVLGAAAGVDGLMLSTLLRCLRYEGRLVPIGGGSLSIEQFRYVDAATWAPELRAGLAEGRPDDATRAELAAWLAARYLHAFGPARVADFAWWSGLHRTAAHPALSGLDTVDVGDGLLLPRPDLAAYERLTSSKGGTVTLLPKWDSYTMGLAPDGRARLVDPDVQGRVYSKGGGGTLPGDGFPVVLLDGAAIGLWRLTKKHGPWVELFDRAGSRTTARIDAALADVATFLGG